MGEVELRLRCFSLVLLLSGMCAFARVGVSAVVRPTNDVCVRAVSACVRACRGERVAVVVGRGGLHV